MVLKDAGRPGQNPDREGPVTMGVYIGQCPKYPLFMIKNCFQGNSFGLLNGPVYQDV